MMVDVQEQYIRELSAYFWENHFNQDESVVDKLSYFADFITEKNEQVNLISRKDIHSIVENHIFLSAYILKFIPDKLTSFLDIGTGGGFPGMPVAICKPNMNGVLVDSIGKKIDAVNEFITKLRLSNVKAVNSRVESPEFIAEHKGMFDLILSRATVPLDILLRYSIPLIKEKAYLAAIKGGDLTEEIKSALLKFKPYIKQRTLFELSYKPSNVRNQKGKKLVLLELNK